MASSNRHWPSLFKSKPCSTDHQWQHDLNHSSLLSSAAGHKSSFSSGGEERSPEPKPRWNPKPEQIRILEAIFNSGMVNPPRDEIRKIRAQLQEYGQVGDANVFYWFQNRKSRSKHKQRHLINKSRGSTGQMPTQPPPISMPLAAVTTSSSSSSSEKSSAGSDKVVPLVSVSPTASVNQLTYFHSATDFFANDGSVFLQGSGHRYNCLSTPAGEVVPGLWSELMMGQEANKGVAKMQTPNPNPDNSNVVPAACVSTTTTTTTTAVAAPLNEIQDGGGARSTVFINGVGFEVVAGPLNVREVFGEEAVLIHSYGHPVLTDGLGFTLHPLQHGASYCLI